MAGQTLIIITLTCEFFPPCEPKSNGKKLRNKARWAAHGNSGQLPSSGFFCSAGVHVAFRGSSCSVGVFASQLYQALVWIYSCPVQSLSCTPPSSKVSSHFAQQQTHTNTDTPSHTFFKAMHLATVSRNSNHKATSQVWKVLKQYFKKKCTVLIKWYTNKKLNCFTLITDFKLYVFFFVWDVWCV